MSAEANDPLHPQRSIKRWNLASRVINSPTEGIRAFALIVVAYSGSAIGAGVDFAFDSNPNGTADAINAVANQGFNDAALDTAVAAVWNFVAGVFPTD